MPSLLTPNLKVQRAKKHLDSLDGAVKAFRQSQPYRVCSQDDLESKQWVVTVHMDEPTLELGLIAGDFICCLRSSLDWLAWQLVGLTNPNPSDDVCFPICGKDSSGTQGYITKSTKGVPSDAVTIVKQFQPYNSGDAYKTTHLWRLNKLWNIDKHRHIPFHSAAFEIYFPTIPHSTPRSTEVIYDGGIVRFPLSVKQPMDLNPRVGIQVYFGAESEGIMVTVQDLFDIYEFVSGKVIPSFAGFFT